MGRCIHRNGTKRRGKGTNGRCMEAARQTEMVDMEVKMRGEKAIARNNPGTKGLPYRA